MSYISITDAETREMLASIGAAGVDDLFADIPGAIRDGASCELPAALSEIDLERKMGLGRRTGSAVFPRGGRVLPLHPFCGRPACIQVEFYTAYSYQPECAGNAARHFRVQTMICSLTGMDISNEHCATAQPLWRRRFSCRSATPERNRVVVSAGVPPLPRRLKTYAWAKRP